MNNSSNLRKFFNPQFEEVFEHIAMTSVKASVNISLDIFGGSK